jgi:hypothetical protein
MQLQIFATIEADGPHDVNLIDATMNDLIRQNQRPKRMPV